MGSWGRGMNLHRPVNCPACSGDTFGPLCVQPLGRCCCFSAGCDSSPGSLPAPSVVQLADSDGVIFNDSLFCTSSSQRTMSCVHTPGIRVSGQCVKYVFNRNSKHSGSELFRDDHLLKRRLALS